MSWILTVQDFLFRFAYAICVSCRSIKPFTIIVLFAFINVLICIKKFAHLSCEQLDIFANFLLFYLTLTSLLSKSATSFPFRPCLQALQVQPVFLQEVQQLQLLLSTTLMQLMQRLLMLNV